MRSATRDLVRAEVRRKMIHGLGAAIPLLYLFFPKQWLLLGFLVGFVIIALPEMAAMIADGVPLQAHQVPVDDNLTIPLVAGVLMRLG